MDKLRMLQELAQTLVDHGIPVPVDVEAALQSAGLTLEY